MKSDWQYVNNNGTKEKMAPKTLVENVMVGENGPSLKDVMPSNPNLLINGDFQVWQRGTSFTTPVEAYTADRWKAWCQAVSKLSGNGIRVSFSNAWQYIQQTLNDYYIEAGEKLTISARIKSSIARPINVYLYSGATYIGHLAMDATTSYAVSSATITIPSDISSITILCQNTTTLSSDVDIKHIKLERGSIATPYYPRTFAEEYAMCKRYYEKIGPIMELGTANVGFDRVFAFTAEKRIVPTARTISPNGAIDKIGYWNGSGWTDITPSLVAVSEKYGMRVAASLSIYTNYSFFIVSDAEIY